jgi:hypothetical protein
MAEGFSNQEWEICVNRTWFSGSLGLRLLASGLVLAMAACSASHSSSTGTTPQTLSVTLGSSSVVAPQDGTTASVAVTIGAQSGTPAVAVSGLPAGLTGRFATTNGGPSGTITFTGSAGAAAGSYTATVTVTDGALSASQSLTVVSAVVAKVGSNNDTTQGVNGVLKQFMSTSFQVAEWFGDYFGTGATATSRESTLAALGPQHIRLQPVSQGVPMIANTGNASDWDFTLLDQTVQPVLAITDKSPEFQVAVAPAWMCFSNGDLDVANHVKDFAAYAANLVRYYNKGGFDVQGTHFQSASNQPITWWGIFNEPTYNGITPAQYVTIYNTVVPAMLAVDPTIKFSAVEYGGSTLGTGESTDPEIYLPVLFAPPSQGGLNAQIDIVSNHFYSSCNQSDPDTSLFADVPQYADVGRYILQEVHSRPDLVNVPVWTTENNVNADYDAGNGMSACNPGKAFVDDHRGTSAFFAAWRPYVFSQLGKAGNEALYHWNYSGDQQYGEVDPNGVPYLSYWVDKTLAALYPFTSATPGQKILALNATEETTVELLATQNGNGSVTVLVSNHAVQSPADNNGPGAPRTVILDLSSLGSFSSASLLTIDATTSVSTGPTPVSVTPPARMSITLNGYGSAFLTLNP